MAIPGLDAIDLVAVHQLLGLYGHLVDARSWGEFGALFTDDAVVDYTAVRAPSVLRGREEIVAWFASVDHPSAHHVTNIVALPRPGSDVVDVHSKFLAPYTRDGHEPTRWYGGDYHDEVVRTADGWCFARKTCTARWRMTVTTDDDGRPAHRRTF